MFDTNRTLVVARTGVSLAANVQPASAEIKAMLGNPAAKLFDVYVEALIDVREQDKLTSVTPAETYVVTGVEQFDFDLVRHTHLTVEGKWGL